MSPELTIPADYTSECSDDLILDDASATDNCEVIEVFSETIAGDAAGNYAVVARSLRRTTLATARLPRRQSRWRTRRLQNYGSCRLNSECSDDLILDDARHGQLRRGDNRSV